MDHILLNSTITILIKINLRKYTIVSSRYYRYFIIYYVIRMVSEHNKTVEHETPIKHTDTRPLPKLDHDAIKQSTQDFFAPIVPLWKAIITFFQTGLGIVVWLLILTCLVAKVTTAINHRQFYNHQVQRDYHIKEYQIQDNGYRWNSFIITR